MDDTDIAQVPVGHFEAAYFDPAHHVASTDFTSASRLDGEEDGELRRLHTLRGFGMVAESVISRYEALRGRDRRRAVRDVDDMGVAEPVLAQVWAPEPKQQSVPQRAVGDTREIFGQVPESRRGLGIFRR